MKLFSSTMDQLFSMEVEDEEDMIILRDIKSFEDPVLIEDSRILANILDRENDTSINNCENYFDSVQSEIKPHMRKIVSDWMLEVCEEQQCQSDVFFLAVNYMDRVLSKINVKKSQFQLLGCVAIFLASKFKESIPIPVETIVLYTDTSVSVSEILQWEFIVLDVLQWEMSAVTSQSILDHLLRSLSSTLLSSSTTQVIRKHAETFCALAATEYGFFLKSPSLIASSSLAAALKGLNYGQFDQIMDKVEIITGVDHTVIRECMDQIEYSINLSMSGSSYQPAGTVSTVKSKNIQVQNKQQQQSQVPQVAQSKSSISTTPTDLMDVNIDEFQSMMMEAIRPSS